MVRSLFLFPFTTNPGYAISALEALFYQVGLTLATGDLTCVHFGYRSFQRGRPKVLPKDFVNLIEFDFANTERRNIQHLVTYVRKNRIQFLCIVDIQPVHPLFRPIRQAGVTTIVTYWGAPITSRAPTWKLLVKRVAVALSRSKVDRLIFESRAMAELAVYGRGVPREMIDIVPLGVDTRTFHPGHSDYAHQVLGLPKERKIVIYSGHMERRKGVHTLIEAAIDLLTIRQRNDVCFLLCGNRDDSEKSGYRAMYEGKGIDHLIHFGGYRSDLSALYPSCFCGVIPSSGWDSFPRSSLEMAASGLPVVAARLGGLPEAVLDQQTGLLFEPGNAQQLADCLERLLSHPELAAQFAEQGRARCAKEFNSDTQLTRMLAVVCNSCRSAN
ncbi:MAG: glycosyltransferase [Nitrososphaera sp.]|nr:glycosyltransferase [Nitrososphaera sp.]